MIYRSTETHKTKRMFDDMLMLPVEAN